MSFSIAAHIEDSWFEQEKYQRVKLDSTTPPATDATVPEESIYMEKSDFSLTLITPTTDDKIKEAVKQALRTSMRDWVEIIQSRKCTTEKSSVGRVDSTDLISEDQDTLIDYKSIAVRISFELNASSSCFMVLTDQEQRVQAVAALTLLPDELYVSALLSAAWNIDMHGENAPEHKTIAVRGAGTSLMRQVYEFAKQQQKSRISLYSIRNSERFYSEKLKMKGNGKQTYYYDVSKDTIPDVLRSSKNLLR